MLDKTNPQELPLDVVPDVEKSKRPRVLVQNTEGILMDPFPPGSKAEALFNSADAEKISHLSDEDFDFSWSKDLSDIVVPSQPAIAVYKNPKGEIIIRQEAIFGNDEDHWIYVQYQNLDPLIEKLKEINSAGPR